MHRVASADKRQYLRSIWWEMFLVSAEDEEVVNGGTDSGTILSTEAGSRLLHFHMQITQKLGTFRSLEHAWAAVTDVNWLECPSRPRLFPWKPFVLKIDLQMTKFICACMKVRICMRTSCHRLILTCGSGRVGSMHGCL